MAQSEIVLLMVRNARAALSAIECDADVTDLGWADAALSIGMGLDVWGKRSGEKFRLFIQSL